MTKAPGLLLAGAVALLGLASPAVGRAENPSKAGTVTAVAGPVTVARQSANPQPLRFRDNLFWRDVVEARKDGIARVLLVGKTTVTLRELSRLELREEVMAEGIRYTAELVSGKVRASVARMLMRPGDQMEIRTKNAVASVRGTDFIVETLAVPSQARAFGLLGVLQVAQAVGDGGSQTGETVVVTLSGAVDVSNRLAGTGRVERVRAYETVRVSGRQDPLRVHLSADDLRVLLQGLTPPRPQEARSGDKSDAVGKKVEQAALTTSAQSVRVFEQAGGDGSQDRPRAGAGRSRDQSGGEADDDDAPVKSKSTSPSQLTSSPSTSRSREGDDDDDDRVKSTSSSPLQPASSPSSSSTTPSRERDDSDDERVKSKPLDSSRPTSASSSGSATPSRERDDDGRPKTSISKSSGKAEGGDGKGSVTSPAGSSVAAGAARATPRRDAPSAADGKREEGGKINFSPGAVVKGDDDRVKIESASSRPGKPVKGDDDRVKVSPASASQKTSQPASPQRDGKGAGQGNVQVNATVGVKTTPPAPATPTTPAAPAAAASPAAGQAVGKPATPPGQAKK